MPTVIPTHGAPTRRQLLASLAMGLTGAATAQTAPREIRIASEEWHELSRKDGTGMYFDLIRMVFEKQGIKVKLDMVPYPRSVHMVKTGKADAWVASFMNEHSFPLYPKWHFDEEAEVVVFKKERAAGFQGENSLRDQRVGWMRDYNYDRQIPVPMKISEFDSFQNAFQMLRRDRIDYLIGPQQDIDADIKKYKVDMSALETRVLMQRKLYLAFGNNPRGAEFLRLWDQEMETMHASDAFKAVYKKYAHVYPFSVAGK
jgi:polar amino acid transport system substrate-binding protein